MSFGNDILQTKCDLCGEIAHEPYIECCECECNVCTGCFASGRESESHSNDHKYAVRRNDFPLFDNCNWTAKEECKLLSALATYGYGNWEEIAKIVHTRSKLECQEHYKKYYIDSVQYKELELLPETEQSLFPKPITPFIYSPEVCKNPPRNNSSDPHLAGYNAFRSEFELSYDNNAETMFNFESNYSDDEDDDCMDALKVSLVNALNTRLKERDRRYTIIKNHGLIMPNKLASWVQKFDATMMRSKAERLLSFMQFMTGIQFDAFMESMSLEDELQQSIAKLCAHRTNGIRTLHAANLFKQLKKKHEVLLKEQKQATILMTKKFDSQSPIKNSQLFGRSSNNLLKFKRTTMPLDIEDLPGYAKLSESERVLCSNLRLLPENYLEIKDQLVAQNSKMGCLKLLDARKIVKIDVNKTRKIYDYLLYEGFITKPL